MRHGVKLNKLGRPTKHRKAMLNNLATSVLEKGLETDQSKRHIKTTLAKAKAVRGLVDRLITYGKKGDLSAKRQAIRFVQNKKAFQGLFSVLGDRYQERSGGYSRILKIASNRHGDNAQMAIITLVEDQVSVKPKKKKSIGKTRKKSVKGKPAPATEAALTTGDEETTPTTEQPTPTTESPPESSGKATAPEESKPE